jgi:hypothetical protein
MRHHLEKFPVVIGLVNVAEQDRHILWGKAMLDDLFDTPAFPDQRRGPQQSPYSLALHVEYDLGIPNGMDGYLLEFRGQALTSRRL